MHLTSIFSDEEASAQSLYVVGSGSEITRGRSRAKTKDSLLGFHTVFSLKENLLSERMGHSKAVQLIGPKIFDMRKDHLQTDGLCHLQKNLSQIKKSTVSISKPSTE